MFAHCASTEVGRMRSGVEDNLRKYVDRIFDEKIHFTNEEICRFAEAIEDCEARYIFAKELNSRRHCCSLEVTVYHKLLHSVALTLFESTRKENYTAGSILVNMAFTYYYVPKAPYIVRKAQQTNHKYTDPELRTLTAKCRDFLSSILFCFHSIANNDDKASLQDNRCYLSPSGDAIYLYESLKNHTVWKSLRFWDEIFFVAVGCERTKRCTNTPWILRNRDERDAYNLAFSNITFGQMSSFLNNMKLLELPKITRMEFLRKQCEIGGIAAETHMYFSLLELV